jgi:hypothetical protein
MQYTFAPTRKLRLRLVLLHATAGLVGGPSNVVYVAPQ